MPRQPSPRLVAVEDQFAKRVSDTLDQQAPALAERLGPPPGSDRYTQRDVEALWDTPDTQVDVNALYRLLQQGLPAEQVQRYALFKMAPDLAKLVTAMPVDAARAAIIAKLAEYPGRYVLTVGHSSDPGDQVAFVEDQHKRAAKRQGMAGPAPAPGSNTPVRPGGF